MLIEMGKRARLAAQSLARADTDKKNATLSALAGQIMARSAAILAANALDVADGRSAGLTPALLDRLTLTAARLQGIISELHQTIALPDPVGESFEQGTLPNGLKIHKQRVPLGVIGVIYESRPNVTIDVAGLALKSGNAVILRGQRDLAH
jgi:glutamate-5-semialdehyde dehydrogenase